MDINLVYDLLHIFAYSENRDHNMNVIVQEHEGKFYALAVPKVGRFPERRFDDMKVLSNIEGIPCASGDTRDEALIALHNKVRTLIVYNRTNYVEWVFKVMCGKFNTPSDGVQREHAQIVINPEKRIRYVYQILMADANHPQVGGMTVVTKRLLTTESMQPGTLRQVMENAKYRVVALLWNNDPITAEDHLTESQFIHGLDAGEIDKLIEDPIYPMSTGSSHLQAIDNLKRKMTNVEFDFDWLEYYKRVTDDNR